MNELDIVLVRREVRRYCTEMHFSLINMTKLVTAASEIARNTLVYGGGGEVEIQCHDEGIRRGIRAVFTDKGCGIHDIALAMTDGFSTGVGLGFGLSGSKRLVDQFEISSTPGIGTTVSITKWK